MNETEMLEAEEAAYVEERADRNAARLEDGIMSDAAPYMDGAYSSGGEVWQATLRNLIGRLENHLD